MDTFNNPHDKFFKEVMSDIENARAFLQNYLPSEILQSIHTESIKIEKDSFIEKDLTEYFADLLFQAKVKNEEAYVYVLFEHKSYNDKNISLQLLKYMTSIWQKAA